MKRQLGQCLSTSLVLIGMASATIQPTIAQPVRENPTPIAQPAPENPPADTPVYIVPRGGIRYTTQGAGFDPYLTFEGFYPLQQTPGQSVTFVQGRFLLFTPNTALGGNITVGYRFLNPGGDRIFGGYLSYDNRNTGNAGFNQIGAGLESLSDDLDFRINGYLPIGQTRPLISTSLSGFSAQQGLLQAGRVRQFEEALPGLDAEVGTRITNLGDLGILRGYGGLYYYGGGANVVGVRGRLVAQSDYANIGLSLQNDGRFDTRLVLTVGVNFPSSGDSGGPTTSLLNRLGDSVERLDSITVDKQTVTDTIPLTNRTTGLPILASNLGSGSFDNILQAFNSGLLQPNSTLFVGNVGGNTDNLSVQSGVSLVSTFSTQQLDTAELGTITLAGTGVRPTIAGNVNLAGNNLISGFNITGNVTGGSGNNLVNSTLRSTNLLDNNTLTSLQINGPLTLRNTNAVTSSTITGPFVFGNSNTIGTTTITGATTGGNSNALSGITITGPVTLGNQNRVSTSSITGNLKEGNSNTISATSITGNLTGGNNNILSSNSKVTGTTTLVDTNTVSNSQLLGNVTLGNSNILNTVTITGNLTGNNSNTLTSSRVSGAIVVVDQNTITGTQATSIAAQDRNTLSRVSVTNDVSFRNNNKLTDSEIGGNVSGGNLNTLSGLTVAGQVNLLNDNQISSSSLSDVLVGDGNTLSNIFSIGQITLGDFNQLSGSATLVGDVIAGSFNQLTDFGSFGSLTVFNDNTISGVDVAGSIMASDGNSISNSRAGEIVVGSFNNLAGLTVSGPVTLGNDGNILDSSTVNGTVIINSTGAGTNTISNNTIKNTAGGGIVLTFTGPGLAQVFVTNNDLRGSSAEGLSATASTNAQVFLSVLDNNAANSIGPSTGDMVFQTDAAAPTANLCVQLHRNTADDDYIFFNNNATATLNVQATQPGTDNLTGTFITGGSPFVVNTVAAQPDGTPCP